MVGAAGATQIIEDSSEWGTDDSWWAMPAREIEKYSHGSNVASSIDWSVALGTWTRLWTLRGSTVLSLSEMEVEAPQAAQGSLQGFLPKPASGSHEGSRHWSPMGHCFRFSSDRHLSLSLDSGILEASQLASPTELEEGGDQCSAAYPSHAQTRSQEAVGHSSKAAAHAGRSGSSSSCKPAHCRGNPLLALQHSAEAPHGHGFALTSDTSPSLDLRFSASRTE